MSKFNIKKDDVKSTIAEVRNDRKQERLTELTDRLNQAATDGKISDEQKTKLLELFQTVFDAEDEVDQKREELQTWAENNDIVLRDLMGMGQGNGMHPGGRMGFGDRF